MIDWNKPLEIKVWGCRRKEYNHDWLPVLMVKKTSDGTYSVWDEPDSNGFWGVVDEDGVVYAWAEKIGAVRNKPETNPDYTPIAIPTREVYDSIEKPSHYNEGRKYETIDVIEDWNLGYHLSNALKYLSRYNRKGDDIQDLKKAIWYIQRKIKLEEATE